MEPFLLPFLSGGEAAAASVAESWSQACEAASHVVVDDGLSDDEEGNILCNCEFSLAYGGGGSPNWGQKTPLRAARAHVSTRVVRSYIHVGWSRSNPPRRL